ncbi:MAG: PA domain-containing protein [Myxococcales bacterium]|nr:PA domain-containing protein [Myxococcales bacterium]
MLRLLSFGGLAPLAVLLLATDLAAQTTITINNVDSPGEGLNDPTPVEPVGGNEGTTIGEQRLNALRYAAELWAAALDSPAEITIDAGFDDPACAGGAAVLGQAGPVSVASNVTGSTDRPANPDWVYVAALANAFAGEDLRPADADVLATFNGLSDPSCSGITGWYYGLDGEAGDQTDLVEVALHEIAHGLGIAMLVVGDSGELLIGGAPDPLTAQAFDLSSGQYLGEMSDSERLASLSNVRQVVWDGPRVTERADVVLARGTPTLGTSPEVPGLSGIVSDTNFGAPPLSRSASGPLVLGTPINGIGAENGDVAGKVVLYRPVVRPDHLAAEVASRGGVAVLIAVEDVRAMPPLPIDLPNVVASDVPVLSISVADADALELALSAGEVMIQLSEDPDRAIGTSEDGRVYLDATVPVSDSTLSHWDMATRPNLLMEPISRPRDEPHGYGLALAWLQDLGWAPACGNGRVDPGEGCDEGADNSDELPDACRENCQPAGCGDRVVDDGEACDDGPDNRDDVPDTCRTDCSQFGCGDGVVDSGETCDDGAGNSDVSPGACRSDCAPARCGDGVVDPGEGCDDGDDNGDEPDACRSDCSVPRCGDGIVDTDEECEPETAEECTSACRLPRCGDSGSGAGCPDAGAPERDCGSACDAGQPVSTPGPEVDASAPSSECDGGCEGLGARQDATEESAPDPQPAEEGGCGCHVLGRPRGAPSGLLAAGLLLLGWRRKRVAG